MLNGKVVQKAPPPPRREFKAGDIVGFPGQDYPFLLLEQEKNRPTHWKHVCLMDGAVILQAYGSFENAELYPGTIEIKNREF